MDFVPDGFQGVCNCFRDVLEVEMRGLQEHCIRDGNRDFGWALPTEIFGGPRGSHFIPEWDFEGLFRVLGSFHGYSKYG